MGFMPVSQDAAMFGPGSIKYHKWEGISDDTDEQKSIQGSLGSDALNLIMNNHGACCMGDSVGAAWVRAWYLEKCCRLQLELLKSGQKIIQPDPQVMEKAVK